MANSRKSRSRNNRSTFGNLQARFERALGEILARVCVSTTGSRAKQPAIAIAYSGGLDSSVLLRLMRDYADARGISIQAFHVHHGLSRNADVWLDHCESYARRHGVPFSHRAVSIVSGQGRSIEEAARSARYAALGKMCLEHGVELLLTAHHQDDQAETVLLQLMRGAGLPGLSGMALLQQEHPLLGGGIALGRPLLEFSRAELEQAAHGLALSHVIDESNADVRYRRNALRHDIAPALEKYFPGYAAAVVRSATHAQSAQMLAHDLAVIDLQTCGAGSDYEELDLLRLNALPSYRADNVLRHWLHKQGVQLPSAARLHEIRVQMAAAHQDTHPFFDFGAVRLHRIGRSLQLQPLLGAPPREPVRLVWRGEQEIAFPQWHGKLIFDTVNAVPGIDPRKLQQGPLSLHSRTGRERLKLAENRPSRTLKNLFQERSIAAWRRPWLPLLYLDADLVFAAELGMDVRYAVQQEGVQVRWVSDSPMHPHSMLDC